jgi:prepilin-type N-terminal cleavage/methylation domain-containing protein
MQPLPSAAAPRRRNAGFSLVEIMIVTLIIGMLTLLAWPALVKVRQSAQNSRFISDLRTFSHAFESYSMETGLWPPNAGAGVVPAIMTADKLRASSWLTEPTIGGRWNWDAGATAQSFGFFAGISVTNQTATDLQMTLIDQRIDDGNLTTGLFRKTAVNRFSYILQEL